jgi:hypothetical protein
VRGDNSRLEGTPSGLVIRYSFLSILFIISFISFISFMSMRTGVEKDAYLGKVGNELNEGIIWLPL